MPKRQLKSPRLAPAPRRTRVKGRMTRDAIITAARKVLVDHGHVGFTLKRVADSIGISLGNLCYHFPTRVSLVEVLIDRILQSYLGRFEAILGRDPGDLSEALCKLLRWAMEDTVTPSYGRLFRELWALSLHDPSIAAAMDKFYDESIEPVVRTLAGGGDTEEARRVRDVVFLICAISEGSAVMFGTRRDSGVQFRSVQQLALDAIRPLSRAPTLR